MKSALKKTAAGCFIVLLAALCAAAQQPAQTAAQPDSGYVLGPDDQIVIRAIDAPEISDKPMPHRNERQHHTAADRTSQGGRPDRRATRNGVEHPAQGIRARSAGFGDGGEIRSQPVSVFGAVTKPGVVQLQGRKTLYEVLSMAGGPRETAGSSLTVTRRRENGEIPLPGATIDPTGQFSTAELNVQEILEGKNPAANIEIKPNDMISVSEANSNMIYVVGDVQARRCVHSRRATEPFRAQSAVPRGRTRTHGEAGRRRGSFAVSRGSRSPRRSP